MTVLLYLIMYGLLYAAAIKLRYSQPDVPRTYKVPGGNPGMWLTAGTGFIAVLFAFIVSFFPPAQLTVGSPAFYISFLIAGVIIFVSAPIIINRMKKPAWMPNEEKTGE
jgi:amino acid transporter